MKIIYLSTIAFLLSFTSIAQVNIALTAPSTSLSNGTTGLRAPNGNASHTSMRGCYFVPASELSALGASVTSFGFVLSNTLVSAPASGTLTVYLMNTTANSYTLGTAWSTATVGMTQVYSGVYNIPTGNVATTVDFNFPSTFNYNTGNGLFVAYNYVGGQFAPNAAIYTAYTNSAVIAGATNNSLTLPAAETLTTTTFRPLFRFGNPNPITNDVAIQILNAAGKVSETTGTAQQISAKLFNGSNTVLNNINVDLAISGTNPFTSSLSIASLAAGASTTVLFPTYTPTSQGISNIIISIPSDQNNANNTRNITQSVTCNVIASGPTSLSPVSFSSGVGFNTGSGRIYSSFETATTQTLVGTYLVISSGVSNVGKTISAAVADNSGIVIATSNTLTITMAELNTYQYFSFTPLVFNGGTTYHVGMTQLASSPGYFPLGSTPAPSTPSLYFTQSLTNSQLNPLSTNLGYFAIEPVFSTTLCSMVGISEVNNNLWINTSVYPNPTNDKVIVEVANFDQFNSIEVYSSVGKLVYKQTDVRFKNELDLSSYTQGVYFIKISNGIGSTTKRIIKN